MINLLIAGAGLALITITVHGWLADRRRRRERHDLRHIVLPPEWWGKR